MAWLLVLWGAYYAGVTAPFFFKMIREGWDIYAVILQWFLGIFQGILCLIAGITTLIRSRSLTRWSLFAAGLCWIGIAGAILIDPVHDIIDLKFLMWSLGFLLAALLLFFLGWWLGRQEDIEV